MTESTSLSERSCCGGGSGKAASSPAVPTKPAPAEPQAGSCCSSSKPKTEERAPTAPPKKQAGWQAYQPLIVIGGLSLLVAIALQFGSTSPSWMGGMSQFMGVFLVVFSMLKLFDIAGFAKGFAKYDLAAGAFPPYAYLYPFLELAFGLALLAGIAPVTVNACLAGLMFFGALGVLRALVRGENLRCACLGSTLNVPLSTVAVVEDVGMGLMALVMLKLLSH